MQDTLGQKLGLSGSTSAAITQLIAPKGEVRDQLTVVGVVVLLFSVLSFVRTLQHVYERIWELPRLGALGTA